MSKAVSTPRVSVIITAFNAERYLADAIESVIRQTLKDFELIIVDDGSTDATAEVARSFDDPRIRFVSLRANQGPSMAMNYGIDLSLARYIARMDADDICHPERLEKQVAFMDANREVGICGTQAEVFGNTSRITRRPINDAAIRCRLLFNCVINHPTIIIRRDILPKSKLHYDTSFRIMEDYEFYVRCAPYTQFANIDEVLLKYRTHPEQLTAKHTQSHRAQVARSIHSRQLEALGYSASEEEMDIHEALASWNLSCDKDFLLRVDQWLRKIRDLNSVANLYDRSTLDLVLAKFWYGACSRNAAHGLWTWRLYRASPLHAPTEVTKRHKAWFLTRCIMNS